MKKSKWKTYAYWVLFTEAVGALSGWLTRNAAQSYTNSITQPPLSPPAVVFPIVWSILFALMGLGAARVYLASASVGRWRGILLFLLQLALNFFWSIIFFKFRAFGFAFIWLMILWALILLMILTFRKVDKPAALLQIPYFLWVTFAAYLNLGVWILNK